MRWPNPTDYQDAVQNPQHCFQDPELKAGRVALLPMGLPRVASGNFASVYELQNGRKRWAVRCFLRQCGDQQRHYEHVSRHLKELWLPFLVDFAYQLEGIRIAGQMYPVVKMQWVDGVALHSYVKKHLKQPRTLLKLAAQWRGLVNSLQGCRLAHGDLQHGNVLVTAKGSVRLVDYDAMYVPALHGTNCAELGHVNYQHPQRQGTHYDSGLDNFSALVIYTALRALAADPGLWDTFHTGENLVFSSADFKNPAQSEAFARLKRSDAPEVSALAHELEVWCCGPFAQIGHFENVVSTALHKAASYHATQQASISHIATATVNIVPNNAPAVATPPAASPAPTPIISPDRWWMSAATAPSQPTKPTAQPAPTPTKPSAIPFAAPRMVTPKQTLATASQPPKAGQIKINPVDGAEMVWIPEGEFLVGGDGSKKKLLRGYWIYRHTVTVAQYIEFCTSTGYAMTKQPSWSCRPKHPVVSISWHDANAYSKWAGGQLPTEEQWEKAARGTDGRTYPWGNDWIADKCCNSARVSGNPSNPSDNDYPSGASPYGVLNMAGNVWEMCQNHNVLRGGAWNLDNRGFFTTYVRYPIHLNKQTINIGFRCVVS